jgi:hypothetical protein
MERVDSKEYEVYYEVEEEEEEAEIDDYRLPANFPRKLFRVDKRSLILINSCL